MPTLYFRDGILSIPGYAFEKAVRWEDTGSVTQLAEGNSLKDGSNVLAKIAPAHTNASVILDREAHIIGLMQTSSEALSTTIRLIDLFFIPRANGDCLVLLLMHPGPNLLGRYLPHSRVNDLLLSDASPTHHQHSHTGDVYMDEEEIPTLPVDYENVDTMDLATFLEFAVQATHCLEMMHKLGAVHREIRANAFHLNSHSGVVRLVHFGNRSVSLEQFGGPTSLVLRSESYEEIDKNKVKEALCYLAPEQTGSVETSIEDHRTDLYSLGVLFWTLLVGRGVMPFEGGPLEILHSIVQTRPMPVHEVRRDVPEVLAQMIEKACTFILLAKSADSRYQSAFGLKADLLECQKRLLVSVSSMSEQSLELIPTFDIGQHDRYMNFTLPSLLIGREKEIEIIRNVIRHASMTFSRYTASAKGAISLTPTGSQVSGSRGSPDGRSDSLSSRSETSARNSGMMTDDMTPRQTAGEPPPAVASIGSQVTRGPRAHGVIVTGAAGAGKSSLILANQAKWREHGLWGHARFHGSSAGPFAALLSCLSSVLRQLMVFSTDLHRFVTALKARLGPQLHNVPLLYEGAPELRDILNLFDITMDTPQEPLATKESRARFQSLVENVFSVLSEVRMFALFLDDIHEADDSSVDLISTLASSRNHLLIFITLLDDKMDTRERVKRMFSAHSHDTWIPLDPLPYPAVASLTARTLRQTKEAAAPLARLIHSVSFGNAFGTRNLLAMLHRQRLIEYDWDRNRWRFDLASVEASLMVQRNVTDPNDVSYLISQLRELPSDARRYIIWASFFGSTFRVTDVALVMDRDESSGSNSDIDEDEIGATTALKPLRDRNRSSIRGLQDAIAEGWLVQRGRDMCRFVAKMSYRIIIMMLHEPAPDIYQIAERAQRCLPLLRTHGKQHDIITLLMDAAESAQARGAHELAYQSLISARSLLDSMAWKANPKRTFSLLLKLAEVSTWRGDDAESDHIIAECYEQTEHPEDRALLLRLRSLNHWIRNEFGESLSDTVLALRALGVDINASPDAEEADNMFEQVKNEILAVGFDAILTIPRTTDARMDLAVSLLGDAGISSYWNADIGLTDIIGLTILKLALRHGISPGTSIGFFFSVQAAAERRDLYRFSADLGKLGLRIADRFGTSAEKARSLVLFTSVVSGYDNVHVRTNLPRLEEATKVFGTMASLYTVQTRLFTCDHQELLTAAEESYNDMKLWAPEGHTTSFATSLLACIRALSGCTLNMSAATVYDTDTFKEQAFLLRLHASGGNSAIAVAWHQAYKVVALFCLGYVREAAILGFVVYESRLVQPNHRHIRYALFFHSLALVACIREGLISGDEEVSYLKQVHANQNYVRKWLSPSPVNNSVWVALVDAELSSLVETPDSYKLYDIAVKLAINNDWLMEEGWALYMQGSHFVRCGVEGLGSELQRRGISRHAQWGARSIVATLSSALTTSPQDTLKRHIFTSDVGVQTESNVIGSHIQPRTAYEDAPPQDNEEDEARSLPASDLAAVLKWSKDISKNIHLFAALQRLTEIAIETSGGQSACIVITGGGGEYSVATSMIPPGLCKVHENAPSIRTISDPLQKAIIQHALNTKERIAHNDVSADSRFSSEAQESPHRAVVCLPIFGNRGQTFGALYLASKYAFSQNQVTLLTLLCQQANISVANALLFRSFYGLLDILSGTELNLGQREIVQTAKQSCELLLKIIDSILDYSKLEASALKLEYTGFSVEDVIADCLELLLPMAAKKLDLSFNIDRGVPAWVKADYARIRQILMNLVGNAVKFTANGSVKVLCSVDNETLAAVEGQVNLKFVIQDTGIGLSSTDVDHLFMPFQQADNSSTRKFGGTGLGLSICRQLVKLMGGVIGVHSELGKGSVFWFTIPTKLFESEESTQALMKIQNLRTHLKETRSPRILICSPSDATQTHLSTMLDDLNISVLSTILDLQDFLRISCASDTTPPLHLVVFDFQSEIQADGIAKLIQGLGYPSLRDTKIVHLYTPVTDGLAGHPMLQDDVPGLVRMTKPPRALRLLQTLAGLAGMPHDAYVKFVSNQAMIVEEPPPPRMLYGNVLIAEDNHVAQKLLMQQLARLDLHVIATSNGEEAIAEWEAHEPGFFSLALFDHHMPICDGVEAAKRVRILESRRNIPEKLTLPIVALSADCQDSTKRLCLSAGMNDFLSKPLKKPDLLMLTSTFGTGQNG
ncbi:histidine kinase [Amylostereum chailletii]|nr:histidine kinase [Amylostereum chailletii]